LRPGELHIFFAGLRAVGCFIDGTGIPDLWSVLYSDSTVQQILTGKRFRRALEAHTRTLIALENSHLEAFFAHHENQRNIVLEKVQNLRKEFLEGDVNAALNELQSTMNQCKLRSLINAFDTEQSEAKPTFKML